MSEPLFVDDPLATYIGAEALRRLRGVNDARFAGPHGVLRVDRTRWEQAQRYERKTWMDVCKNEDNARNFEWAEGFNQYAALPHDLGDVIELGCGPFTNLRLMLESRTARTITLLDPLITDYVQHPFCPYTDGTLAGIPVRLINSTLEDWHPEPFDTVVMVNVLHHCYDAQSCLHHVREAVKPGGWLIFYDPPREIDPALVYDVGHPLSPNTLYMELFIGQFEPVFRNEWFFIGRAR